MPLLNKSLVHLGSIAVSALVWVSPALAGATEEAASKLCSKLAAAVDDNTKPAGVPGIEMGNIDGAKAVAACEQAVTAFPDDLRLVFQLGRAQQAEGLALEKAFANYSKAAEGGHALAMNHLGFAYENGTGVAIDIVKATAWYLKAAEAGSARAQRNIGISYMDGTGVARDLPKSMQWFMKSAEQGYPPAINYVGILYDYGWGVKQDFAEAAKWYDKAAQLNDADAMSNLGMLYDEGKGVPKDQAKAVALFQQSAGQDNAGGINNLGWAYDRGIGGLPKDIKKANELYLKAADLGEEAAMFNYGESLLTGDGVSQNTAKALVWMNKALDAKSERAAFALAMMHAKGENLPTDPVKAAELFVTALEGPSDEAKEALVTKKGDGLPPAVINALQDKLIARGGSFAKTDGNLSLGAISYMESILSGG
jgi:TPR repeat protein